MTAAKIATANNDPSGNARPVRPAAWQTAGLEIDSVSVVVVECRMQRGPP